VILLVGKILQTKALPPNQSFFLVKAQEDASANFRDKEGKEHFSLTFEVDGADALRALHSDLQSRAVALGEIEDRGHPGAVRLCCQKGEETMLRVSCT
jgi:hypothetical protein